MKNEYELIDHHKVTDIKVFLIEISYRRPHLHTDLEIIYCMKGDLKIQLENKVCNLKQGEFFILNSYQLHEFISKDSTQLLIVQFNTKSIEHVYPEINEILFENIAVTEQPKLLYYFLTLCQIYFKESMYFHLTSYGYAILTLNELLNAIPYKRITNSEKENLLSRSERIVKVSKFINQNYTEKILLSNLAKQENITTSYLSNFIRVNFGHTFQELVNFARCEQAKYLLANSKDNLLTISQNCGFSDVRYMNKSFKSIFGITPHQFRTNHKVSEIPQHLSVIDSIDVQTVLPIKQSIDIIENKFDSFSKRLLHV